MIKLLAASLFVAIALTAHAADAKKPAPAKAKKSDKAPAPKGPSMHDKFAALDLNKDGVIDKEELETYEKLVSTASGPDGKAPDAKKVAETRAAIEAEYKKEDAAHDGKVTEKEFEAADAKK